MVELASAQRDATAQPFADVLSNVGRPSLSGTSDMPAPAAEPAPADDGQNVAGEGVDAGSEAAQPADTSVKTEGEADAGPKETGGEDKTSPQQRAAISRYKNQAKAAEALAKTYQSQLDQALAAVKQLTEKPQAEDPRPSRETFDTPEDYDQALETWVSRRAKEEAKAEAQVQQTQQEQLRRLEAVRNTYQERADKFSETHDDYFDLVNADDAGFTLPMTAAILENEDGPEVAYHLATHPEMLQRIAKLTQAQQVFEIGKLSAKLATPPAPKPAPIRHITGRSTPAEKTPDEMSMAEYVAWKKAKQKAS